MLGFAQHDISAEIKATENLKSLEVSQNIVFKNNTETALSEVYLYDWINAFSDKNSPLGKRYAQEYVRKFHFATDQERGGTTIEKLNINGIQSNWSRVENQPDIIKVELKKKLEPGESIVLNLDYKLIIPDAKFTGFGWLQRELILKEWLIKPAIYKEDWIIYSHKNLNDFPFQKLNYDLKISVPNQYKVTSTLMQSEVESQAFDYKTFRLQADNHIGSDLYVTRIEKFKTTKTDLVDVKSSMISEGLRPEIEALITDRIVFFLKEEMGDFSFEEILISEEDYLNSPVYGLNQLPDFIRPFPDGFQFDIKLLKTTADQFLRKSLLINTRENQWFLDAILVKIMMDYVEKYYPEVKLLGSFADFYGVKWFHAAELKFNDRYQFIHETMIRQNLGQPVDFPQDSLLKFNQKLSNPYKGGIGFKYLEDYLGKNVVDESLKIYFETYHAKFSDPKDFFEILQKQSQKEISWFTENYLGSKKDIDFTIDYIKTDDDSISVRILNKTQNAMPVAVYQIKDKIVLSKTWVDAFEKDTIVKLKDLDSDRLAVNYEQIIPEFNQRNNFKSRGKILNKPLQFRIIDDIEDPKYNQLFLIPEFTYNLYDGIALGPKFYNSSILPKQFEYKMTPKYGLRSQTLVGDGSVSYTHFYKNEEMFALSYGLSGSRYSYDEDLFYNRYSGYLSMTYRPEDLRDNRRHGLSLRTVNVDQDESPLVETDEPNYNIFNIRYTFQNKNLDRFFTTYLDYQIAKKFSKVSGTMHFRKLFNNNRQINMRIFAGLFLYNDTQDSNYFSYALDRPTDYLFDYNYYGRSESSGLFSQQFIMAEGGFKSQFDQRFADEWLLSTNVSTTIWNWIFAYGDAGVFSNSSTSPQFVYDSGIRLNFVEDYFELYFPMYSSNGWEFGNGNYDEKIRFVVTLDISTLLKLFKRKWY